jgi:hypothetical protein
MRDYETLRQLQQGYALGLAPRLLGRFVPLGDRARVVEPVLAAAG